jgi:succinate dehydrogenase / fumarate reductase membrane anchor subunit
MSLYVLEGLRPWVIQRVSAVYMALFFIYAAFGYISAESFDYNAWRSWLFNPINTTLVGIFTIAVLFHAWIGMRDVVLDYVHNIMLRIFVLGLVLGVLIGSAMMVFSILLLSVVA